MSLFALNYSAVQWDCCTSLCHLWLVSVSCCLLNRRSWHWYFDHSLWSVSTG